MGQRRQISWATAMRDLRRDREPSAEPRPMLARSFAIARATEAVQAFRSRPLRPDGQFDRAAIMSYAAALAGMERAQGSRLPWRHLIRSALRWVWARAKTAA